ncbi:MAG: carbamoyltransferase HypF [Anaerolinea sp.]|nr:carbamoyltransferase HypF [Anaerolinea sp.]
MNHTKVEGRKILIKGIVQGVGFRPFVYTQAIENHLTGWVRNISSGVEIEINGLSSGIENFLHALKFSLPPLARIDHLEVQDSYPNHFSKFEILASHSQPGDFIPVSPDMAICPDCHAEMLDPDNRRFRYPFINCTNCGPRFTIIQDIPYDRPKTTMAEFVMCDECHAEYENPLDRRFHAQPVACPVCGPQVWFEDASHQPLAKREGAINLAREWLRAGKIIAIKGLGGFHLACDATNENSVQELRNRKKRSQKPFALMTYNLKDIEQQVNITPQESKLLQSPQKPVVLMQKSKHSTLCENVAPGQNTLGFMLPYTPLHLLLLEPAPGFPEVLVMTSGNISDEPIAYTDQQAADNLAGLADGFLLHNRDIHIRTDDSVVRLHQGQNYFIRRARGYAPDPILLNQSMPEILAVGAELKNTFCLTKENYAFVSHHIGDMENYETYQSFIEGIDHFQTLFRVQPSILAADLHPNYLATRYAQERAESESLPIVSVQHHHAHLASCLAENHFPAEKEAIGVIFDGSGYGTDGAIWGGEFLIGNCQSFHREFHLSYAPLPGGDMAIRKPARMALAHLWQAGEDWQPELPPCKDLCYDERTLLRSQLQHQINTPLTSSMGRLFDAVSALIGVQQTATYEGQAAIEMESIADPIEQLYYSFSIEGSQINPVPLFRSIIADWSNGTPIPNLAARFHNSVARMTLDLCLQMRNRSGINSVALSGGVWQNQFLLQAVCNLLAANQFDVLIHRLVPANDGGISLGQAVIAANTRL